MKYLILVTSFFAAVAQSQDLTEQQCLDLKVQQANQLFERFQVKDLVRIYQKAESVLIPISESLDKYPLGTDPVQYDIDQYGYHEVKGSFMLSNFALRLAKRKLEEAGLYVLPPESAIFKVIIYANGKTETVYPNYLIYQTNGSLYIAGDTDTRRREYVSAETYFLQEINGKLQVPPGTIHGIAFNDWLSHDDLPTIYVIHSDQYEFSQEFIERYLDKMFEDRCPELHDKYFDAFRKWEKTWFPKIPK